MSPQASEDSPEGAAAFVKHYVDVFNYAAATGDVDELSRLSAPACTACQRYSRKFREIYANGDRISETLWTLVSDEILVDEKNRLATAVDVNEGELTRYQLIFDLSQNAPFVVKTITIGKPK